jgi:hypothetical protein
METPPTPEPEPVKISPEERQRYEANAIQGSIQWTFLLMKDGKRDRVFTAQPKVLTAAELDNLDEALAEYEQEAIDFALTELELRRRSIEAGKPAPESTVPQSRDERRASLQSVPAAKRTPAKRPAAKRPKR